MANVIRMAQHFTTRWRSSLSPFPYDVESLERYVHVKCYFSLLKGKIDVQKKNSHFIARLYRFYTFPFENRK